MEVDTALVLRIRILEIVGEAGGGRKFVSARWIEIGIGAAGIDRAVTDAEIGKRAGS